MELSVSPEHARALAGFAEWHLDPGGRPLRSPYVLCLEKQCVRVGAQPRHRRSPHVFNNDLDSMTFMLRGCCSPQRLSRGIPLEQPMVAATVDSPVGPLDCLVGGASDDALADLEGAPLPKEAALDLEAEVAAPWCVDQRGMVLGARGRPLLDAEPLLVVA